MNNPGMEKAPQAVQSGGPMATPSASDRIAPLSAMEATELADLRKRAGLDGSRLTWLDLQVGDRFWHMGEELGVLWTGPVEEFEPMTGRLCKQVAAIPVAGGPSRVEWAFPEARLLGGVTVATPELAAAARAYWQTLASQERAELARLRKGWSA